ncbi:hypothetical protein FOZ63_019208, partial [Perkinsus olseni]
MIRRLESLSGLPWSGAGPHRPPLPYCWVFNHQRLPVGVSFRRLSVSEVKGEFKLRKLASKRNDEPVSDDDSFLTDDDDFINDDTSEEDEEAAGGWT